jgi:hypothetical protein
MGGLLVNRGLCESIRGGYENAERYLVLALQEKLEPDYIGACYYYLAEGAIRLHDKDSAVGYLIEGSALPRNAYTGRLEALLVFLENNQD